MSGAVTAALLVLPGGLELRQHRRDRDSILQELQRGFEHRVLTGRFIGRIERVPVSKRDQERPRRLNAPGHLAKQLNRYCRNPLALELCGDQTHGLVTYRSHRDEKRHIHGVLDE